MEIVLNAGEKIINAATLHATKHAYRESLFLLIIAQEELAKLILLPFANAAGNINELIDDKKHKGPYFSHRVKQKIFTSFGLQNRSYMDLEEIKQRCLYTGRKTESRPSRYVAKEDDTYKELAHAAKLYIHLVVHCLHSDPTVQISAEARRVVRKFTNSIFIPALRDIVPSLVDDLQDYVTKEGEKAATALQGFGAPIPNGSVNKELYDLVMTNPFMFVDIMAFALEPNEFKKYFTEISGMSVDEMIVHLRPYVAEVLPKLKPQITD